MRAFLGLFVAAAASAVSGSYLLSPRQNPYPQCAQDCLEVADLGSCLVGEVECLCKNSAFIVSTTQCFEAKCTSGNDLETSESIARQSCAAAGVTLTSSIPPASSTATSPATKPSSTSTSSSSSPSPSASTSSNSNSAASNAVNIIGGVAALGLTALIL